MSETRCNCLALRKATRRITQFYDAVLVDANIRSTQYHIIAHLGRRPDGDTIGRIAHELVLDRATLGHSLKPIEDAGFVDYKVGKDRRSRVISLTKKGKAKLDEARPLWSRAQRAFEKEFGQDDSERLRSSLDSVAEMKLTASPGTREKDD